VDVEREVAVGHCEEEEGEEILLITEGAIVSILMESRASFTYREKKGMREKKGGWREERGMEREERGMGKIIIMMMIIILILIMEKCVNVCEALQPTFGSAPSPACS